MLAAPESCQAKQAKYAHETKEKLRQEKLEKERVLKKIAADRIARKEHEDQRKTVAAHENRRIAGGALASGELTTLVLKPTSTLLLQSLRGITSLWQVSNQLSQILVLRQPRRSCHSRNPTNTSLRSRTVDRSEYVLDDGFGDGHYLSGIILLPLFVFLFLVTHCI